MSEDRIAALAAFWNARYAGEDYAYGTEPNDFLAAQAALLPAGLPVLCLADGEGRNGVWLAGRGFEVTSVDVAQQGLDKAQALAQRAGVSLRTVRADVMQYELGENRWGAIVSIFLHLPQRARAALLARCVRALAPGGVLVFEAYGKRQPEFGTGGPPEPELLARLDDLIDELAGCEIVHRFDGVRAVHEGAHHSGDAHVVQVVARKPLA
ncbi:MAG: SAM-dependent methyltransferase [Burkholderiales bacterium]|jgi:SAM-dependent methyltransferase|nr:MAG: SAM-dependent methyltransferase [Burkholderiales bacterium]